MSTVEVASEALGDLQAAEQAFDCLRPGGTATIPSGQEAAAVTLAVRIKTLPVESARQARIAVGEPALTAATVRQNASEATTSPARSPIATPWTRCDVRAAPAT